MSTVTTIVNAFQTINAGISGVTKAPQFASYPDAIPETDLPIAITLPGAATVYPAGGLGASRKTLWTFQLSFYVAPAPSALASEALTTAATLIEAVGQAYRATKTVDGQPIWLQGNDQIRTLGLVRPIAYYGEQYFGFAYLIPVLVQP